MGKINMETKQKSTDKTASNKIKKWTQTNNKINKLTNLFLLLEMIKQMSKNQLKISLKMLIKINNKTTKKIMIKMTKKRSLKKTKKTRQKMKMMKRENHNQNKEKAIRTRKTEKHSIQTNERKHLKISQSRQNR